MTSQSVSGTAGTASPRLRLGIRDVADEAGVHIVVTHVEQKRGSLVIRTDALGRRVPMDVADAISEIRFHASDRSLMTCERCGALGFMINDQEPRVRCGRCEGDEVSRRAIQQEYRDHIADGCRYYIGVCIKAARLFPVENVIIQVAPTAEEHRLFVDEVNERLVWWRAGSWIEGVDETLRESFRRLDFDRAQATVEEWDALRLCFPEDFEEADKHDALILDQRTRRAGEIRSAALAYVRACARERQVLDIEAFGQRRWPRDSAVKRKIMIDALRDDVASGVPVVDVWQRFEVSGFIARALARAASYGDLYRILRDNGMPIGFRPTDVARWAAEGKISKAEVGEIFGLQDSEIDAFIAAWTSAGEN